MKKLNRKLKKSFLVALIGTSSATWAITNSVNTQIPGVTKLSFSDEFGNEGNCSATIVGYRPLTALTAAHCADFSEDVYLQMENLDSTEQVESTRVVLPDAMIKSEVYQKFIAARDVQRDLAMKVNSFQRRAIVSFGGRFNTLNDSLLLSSYRRATQELNELDLEMTSTAVLVADITVVIFDNVDWYPGADLDELVKEKKVIPVDLEEYDENEEILLAGYGPANVFHRNFGEQHGTMNTLSESNVVGEKAYFVRGALTAFSSKESNDVYKEGAFGSVLPGDSGGPVLSSKGVVGVHSMIRDEREQDFEKEPHPKWPKKNKLFGTNFYNISAHIATRSEETRSLLEKAKALGADIVYSDEVNPDLLSDSVDSYLALDESIFED